MRVLSNENTFQEIEITIGSQEELDVILNALDAYAKVVSTPEKDMPIFYLPSEYERMKVKEKADQIRCLIAEEAGL